VSDQVERYTEYAEHYIRQAEGNSSEPVPTEMLQAGQINALCAIAHAVDRLADVMIERAGH
jgi:hypothetical protein